MTTKSKGRKPGKEDGGSKRKGPAETTATIMATVRDEKRTEKERNAALLRLSQCVRSDQQAILDALQILADKTFPLALRLTALQVAQTASFASKFFTALRPKYLAALRSVMKDEDPELRQRVLGILSREQDGKTQKQLLEGLKNPAKALLSPEKALQLLSYDVHAETYDVAREVIQKPPNEAAKQEALRLLGADANSVKLFVKMLHDKAQSAEVRQICASALHSLDPKKLLESAREILLDEDDDEQVRATGLTALTHFGKVETILKDTPVYKQAAKLVKSKSETLKGIAGKFMEKFRR